jgi:hypothetical protein
MWDTRDGSECPTCAGNVCPSRYQAAKNEKWLTCPGNFPRMPEIHLIKWDLKKNVFRSIL